jgi:hypothetical protein
VRVLGVARTSDPTGLRLSVWRPPLYEPVAELLQAKAVTLSNDSENRLGSHI